MDLVGPATNPPPASESPDDDPWHQEEAADDNSKDGSDKIDEAEDKAETSGLINPGASSAGTELDSADPREVPSRGSGVVRSTGGSNAQGLFDFERVLQDFVLLTFLVSYVSCSLNNMSKVLCGRQKTLCVQYRMRTLGVYVSPNLHCNSTHYQLLLSLSVH